MRRSALFPSARCAPRHTRTDDILGSPVVLTHAPFPLFQPLAHRPPPLPRPAALLSCYPQNSTILFNQYSGLLSLQFYAPSALGLPVIDSYSVMGQNIMPFSLNAPSIVGIRVTNDSRIQIWMVG